ncbi:MAG: dTDP-4-dehydrorhamnose reductase [Halioglobus sp.]
MARKIIVVGAGGQLGTELLSTAPADVECIGLTRAELDLSDADAVSRCLEQSAPEQVINAAAYTAVDKAETEPEAARAGNVEAPAKLARACAARGVRLLHVSTDFVFDGSASSPYPPDAEPSPLGEYGRTKLAGEQAVREALPDALVVRTAWVYSAHGNNFVKTMLRLMAERDELNVVADQVGTPTWAKGLARALWLAVDRPALAGTLHWTDAGACSWYDFAVAICEEGVAMDILPREIDIHPISTDQYPTPATRPAYSVLDKSATWRELETQGIHWRKQLRAMLKELDHG